MPSLLGSRSRINRWCDPDRGQPRAARPLPVSALIAAGVAAGIAALLCAAAGTARALPLVVTTGSLPDGTVGVAYADSIVAADGVRPWTWTIAEGALPAGLSLDANTGAVSGTPGVTGTSGFVVLATDAVSDTASRLRRPARLRQRRRRHGAHPDRLYRHGVRGVGTGLPRPVRRLPPIRRRGRQRAAHAQLSARAPVGAHGGLGERSDGRALDTRCLVLRGLPQELGRRALDGLQQDRAHHELRARRRLERRHAGDRRQPRERRRPVAAGCSLRHLRERHHQRRRELPGRGPHPGLLARVAAVHGQPHRLRGPGGVRRELRRRLEPCGHPVGRDRRGRRRARTGAIGHRCAISRRARRDVRRRRPGGGRRSHAGTLRPAVVGRRRRGAREREELGLARGAERRAPLPGAGHGGRRVARSPARGDQRSGRPGHGDVPLDPLRRSRDPLRARAR
ncbi:MAG: hypothetical protein E6J87_26825, partial [Deltaproteobacteria bacterium]